MGDGYFRLVNTQKGFGIKLIKARDGGTEIKGTTLLSYLDHEKIVYDISDIKRALEATEDVTVELGEGPCPAVNENYSLIASKDRMTVFIRFQAPSDTGKRVDVNEVLADLRVKKIIVGIKMSNLQEHFQSEGCYDRYLIAAQGIPPRQGKDAQIEYLFNTDITIQPTVREDGSVDFFQLNMINHCKAGDVLARLHPADHGTEGKDVFGVSVRPRDVVDLSLHYGRLVTLSEDKRSLIAQADGHVRLEDEKVVVSDVFVTENVDLSTGNIDFTGSVQVNGNVKENMSICAGGNVFVNGVVEGAHIKAGGNIIISQGMKGMTKGTLEAGGNVISKFLENTNVDAEGYVNTESILHSNVSAGSDVVVTGKKGFIAGGRVQAGHLVSVKNLGADMGNTTIVEVGISPSQKIAYMTLQKEISEIVRKIRNAQPVLMNFAEKKKRGASITQEQLKYVAETDKLLKELTVVLNQKSEEMKAMQEKMECNKDARVEVHGVICGGTTIIMGESSTVLNSDYQFCKFENRDGEVKMYPLGR